MDMMTMMMQLDANPVFSSPEMDFSSGSATSVDTFPNPFLNTSSALQQPMTLPPGMRFRPGNAGHHSERNSMEAMREMIYRMAVMQPVHIDPEVVKPPKRRNVKISKDPQSVAARHRRERISERIRILQRLVPGGTKMDTASMLDEAIHYVKFLKKQVQCLEQASPGIGNSGIGLIQTRDMLGISNGMDYSLFGRECQPSQTCGL